MAGKRRRVTRPRKSTSPVKREGPRAQLEGTPSSAVGRAVLRIDRAREALSSARGELTKAAEPGVYRVVSQPEWQRVWSALTTGAMRLRRRDGVIGTGIGYRRVAGEETRDPCVIVVVDRKLSGRALKHCGRRPVPKHLVSNDGTKVYVDVVAVHGFRRLAFIGSSIGPQDILEEGTLGAVGRHLPTGQAVALTAMHVSRRGEADGVEFVTPSRQDRSTSVPLGSLIEGTMLDVDAAAIALNPRTIVVPTIPGVGTIEGWRPVVFPGDRNTTVHFYGAVSGLQSGAIVEPFVNLPGVNLEAAILADIFAQPGDSGAGLVDNSRHLLGLLVAELFWDDRLVRAFSPMGLVLQRLNCRIQ
jgi:hypothetical protein